MKKIHFFLLFLILISAFLVRLYRFDSPIADWHSWRQSDTSSVSRNFVQNGFDVLHPKFDDLSNVPSGLDNPNGYRFVEFPIYNLVQAGLSSLSDSLTLEQWGRIVTIFSQLLSIVFLYLLVKKYAGNTAAIFAAFFFAFLPYNIYFGRTILPDPTMVAASLGGIYFFDKWTENNSKFKIQNYLLFFLSIVFTSSALLLKPYALFFTLPIIYLSFKSFNLKFLFKWQLWLFVVLTLAPLLLWRYWMQQFPEGIPQSNWLFNEGNIRFKGSFFHWIFGDRIGRLILGYFGLPLLFFGLIRKREAKEGLFFISFLFSSLLYLIVMARGNVQHDYYQILIIPSIAIFLGLGCEFVFKAANFFNKWTSYTILLICILFSFMFGWFFVRDFFNINNPSIISAGKAVDNLTEKDAKIIANYNGDTSFLYQTKRKGWASFEKPLPEMIKIGASYLVLVNPKKEDYGLQKEYKIMSSTSDYILFDLKNR